MNTPVLDDATTGATPKPRKNTRPKASDYPTHIEKLILTASHRYHVHIWTRNPFPDEELETHWAIEAWESVSGDDPAPPLPEQIRYVSSHFLRVTTFSFSWSLDRSTRV
jgi:hypothetical protein